MAKGGGKEKELSRKPYPTNITSVHPKITNLTEIAALVEEITTVLVIRIPLLESFAPFQT